MESSSLFERRPDPVRKGDPRAEFEALEAEQQRQRPHWTRLEVFNVVRQTPRGAALWAEINDKSDLLRALGIEKTAGTRVEIRKTTAQSDPGALTKGAHAQQQLEALQQRCKATGLNDLQAWQAALRSPEGQGYAADYRDHDANRSAGELAVAVQIDVDTMRKNMQRVAAGQPTDLHSAIVAVQRRDGVDYIEATKRAVADPRNAALVAEWRQRG